MLTHGRESGMNRDYGFASGARLQFDVVSVTDSGLEYGGRFRFSAIGRRNDVVVVSVIGTVVHGLAPGLNLFGELR